MKRDFVSIALFWVAIFGLSLGGSENALAFKIDPAKVQAMAIYKLKPNVTILPPDQINFNIMEKSPEYARVMYCPQCRIAEKNWLIDNPKSEPDDFQALQLQYDEPPEPTGGVQSIQENLRYPEKARMAEMTKMPLWPLVFISAASGRMSLPPPGK
jgi:hypothetical protein